MKRLKIINGISLPQEDNRGRAFPYKDTGPHFVGVCRVNGQIVKIKVWKNITTEGREYLRFVFDNLDETEMQGYV